MQQAVQTCMYIIVCNEHMLYNYTIMYTTPLLVFSMPYPGVLWRKDENRLFSPCGPPAALRTETSLFGFSSTFFRNLSKARGSFIKSLDLLRQNVDTSGMWQAGFNHQTLRMGDTHMPWNGNEPIEKIGKKNSTMDWSWVVHGCGL